MFFRFGVQELVELTNLPKWEGNDVEDKAKRKGDDLPHAEKKITHFVRGRLLFLLLLWLRHYREGQSC